MIEWYPLRDSVSNKVACYVSKSGKVITERPNEGVAYRNTSLRDLRYRIAVALLRRMPREDRMKVLDNFCMFCGSGHSVKCKCDGH